MSNEQSRSKRKLKFSIDPVRVSDQDSASVRRVLGRLTGKVPFPEEAESAQGNDDDSTDLVGSTDSVGSTNLAGNTILISTTGEASTTTQSGITGEGGITDKSGSTKISGATKKLGSTKKTSTTGRAAPRALSTVSPARDFQKVPNSVTREAMAARLFRGKSKQLYDYLWSHSRGAIVPSRTVRRTRPQIKAGAGFGSMGTVDASIDHLQSVGLLEVQTIVGEGGGNVYEVFTPEEVTASLFGVPDESGSTTQTGTTGSTQNSVLPVVPDSGSTSSTSTSTASEGSGEPKTSFKTKEEKTDDEALALFAVALGRATHDLTGKGLSPSEAQRWAELADVLVTELKIAAGRTTVSSVPAFLAEHLRRRLWKKEKRQLENEPEAAAPEALPSLSKEQTASCPDCFGTGMWYPEGYEKGVAKCRHTGLARPTVAAPAAKQPPPPTDEEAVRAFVDLLHSGTSLDDLDHNFSASVAPERWPAIRAAVLERYERERVRVGSPGAASAEG